MQITVESVVTAEERGKKTGQIIGTGGEKITAWPDKYEGIIPGYSYDIPAKEESFTNQEGKTFHFWKATGKAVQLQSPPAGAALGPQSTAPAPQQSNDRWPADKDQEVWVRETYCAWVQAGKTHEDAWALANESWQWRQNGFQATTSAGNFDETPF